MSSKVECRERQLTEERDFFKGQVSALMEDLKRRNEEMDAHRREHMKK